jgi:hypothetical protein
MRSEEVQPQAQVSSSPSPLEAAVCFAIHSLKLSVGEVAFKLLSSLHDANINADKNKDRQFYENTASSLPSKMAPQSMAKCATGILAFEREVVSLVNVYLLTYSQPKKILSLFFPVVRHAVHRPHSQAFCPARFSDGSCSSYVWSAARGCACVLPLATAPRSTSLGSRSTSLANLSSRSRTMLEPRWSP